MIGFIPKGKLDRNIEDLKHLPKSKQRIHVVPLDEHEWNPISFHKFLETIDNPVFYQSSFIKGRKGNYNSHGECSKCSAFIYHIQFKRETGQIKFILLHICEHIKLNYIFYNGKKITYIEEFQYHSLFRSRNSPSNLFLEIYSTCNNLPDEINEYISQKIISKSFRFITQSSNIINLLKTIPGRWIIYKNQKNGIVKFDDIYVDSIIWISPWAENILNSFEYMQLDASFKLMRPGCYSIPLMVKFNQSLPIGFSIALSEKDELYDRFFDNLSSIPKLNVLCDLGKSLESTCRKHNFNRFVCHRHLIELFNPRSLTGFLITKILVLKTEESYQKFMNYWIPILNSMIKNNKIPKNLEKFQKYLYLEYDPQNETLFESNPDAKKLWAIWERGSINTCSNAIESRHGHLNKKIKKYRNVGVAERIKILTKYIIKSYINMKENDSKIVRDHCYNLQAKAIKQITNGESKEKFQKIDCSCSSKKVYELRFGTQNVDCIHTCMNTQRQRKTPKVILENINFGDPEIVLKDSIVEWPNCTKNKTNNKIELSIDLEDEDPWVSTFIYLTQSIKEMIPNIDENLLHLQMMEIYHTLRSEPKYSNINENQKEIIEEWKNRVCLSIFPENI